MSAQIDPTQKIRRFILPVQSCVNPEETGAEKVKICLYFSIYTGCTLHLSLLSSLTGQMGQRCLCVGSDVLVYASSVPIKIHKRGNCATILQVYFMNMPRRPAFCAAYLWPNNTLQNYCIAAHAFFYVLMPHIMTSITVRSQTSTIHKKYFLHLNFHLTKVKLIWIHGRKIVVI